MTVTGEGTEPTLIFAHGVASAPAIARPLEIDRSIHRLDTVVAAGILALLLVAPIPLGSNRPAFWMIWSIVVGGMALAYGFILYRLPAQPRLGLTAFSAEAVALFCLGAAIVVQLMPIAAWLPDFILAGNAPGINPATISLDPGNSRLVLIQFATFGLLYCLAVQVAADRLRARRMLLGLLLTVALFALIGLLSLTPWGDTLLGFEKRHYLGSATGTFINRNSFATYLAVGLTIGVAMLVESTVKRRTSTIGRLALIVGSIIVIAAALISTGSRLGAFAGLTGATTTFVLGMLMFRGVGRSGAVFTAILLAFTAAGILALFGGSLVERLVFLPSIDPARADAHRIVWAAILQRPWLGYGAGSFATAFQLFQAPPLSAEFVWNYSHSTYLALWFEMGLVIGSLPLLIVGSLGLRAIRAARDPSSTLTSIAAIGTIVVFAVHSVLDFSAEIEANALLFTVILALGAASAQSRPEGEAS